MVSDRRPLRIVVFERVAADVALRRVLILFSILSTHALHRSIGSELLEDRRLPLDKDVRELGERILPDLYHCQHIVIVEIRAKNGFRAPHCAAESK